MLLDATPPLIAGWQNFYLIIGPSAAALLGLQFVVVALVKDAPFPTQSTSTGMDAFTSPTIVHFAAVLAIAAVLNAPWPSLHPPALVLGVLSIALALYVLVVVRRITHVTGYETVAEDWIWHVILPLIAYATIAIMAFELATHHTAALFAIATASMLLLFIGIHNAWDIATYLTLQARAAGGGGAAPTSSAAPDSARPD